MADSPRSCDRRGFLVRSAALLGAGLATACEDGALSPLVRSDEPALARHAGGPVHVFVNESGLFEDRAPFVVGLVLSDDPEPHAAALADLRASLEHFTELGYASNDRFKERYAEAALDHFFAAEDLRFYAVVLNASRSAGGLDSGGAYENLLRAVDPKGAGISLYMEHRFFDPDPDAALEARLEGLPGVSVEFLESHDSDLLQLGDLLTGSVRGDMARTAKGRSNPRARVPGASVKERLIASIKRRVGVQRLAHPSLARLGKFTVRRLHPPF